MSANNAPDDVEVSRPEIMQDVFKMDELEERMEEAETVRDWSFILKDHMRFGNKMLNDNIAIFNIGTAHDCPHIGTDHCQVDAKDCYARQSEALYPNVLDYRRRQEYLWDSLDPDTFADAFLSMLSRMRRDVDVLRFNESGDIRHEGDIVRMERVAERLAEHDILTYTYSAGDYYDFSEADHLTVNASNPDVDGDQDFIVVPDEDDIPEDGFHCPASDPEMDITCGDCIACMTNGGEDEVYVLLREMD